MVGLVRLLPMGNYRIHVMVEGDASLRLMLVGLLGLEAQKERETKDYRERKNEISAKYSKR